MSEVTAPAHRSGNALATVILALTVVVSAAGLVLTIYVWSDMAAVDAYPTLFSVFSGVLYAALGVLIVRRARNRVGWVLALVGLGVSLVTLLSVYAIAAMRPNDLPLPAPSIVGAMAQPVFIMMAIALAFLMFIFPTGSLLSTWWRRVFLVGVVGGITTALLMAVVPSNEGLPAPGGISLIYPNPIRIASNPVRVALVIAVWIVIAAAAAAFVSLIVRYRMGGRGLREQIKWLALVAAAALVLNAGGAITRAACGCGALSAGLFLAVAPVVLIGVPAAMTIAILKHRLYDIDIIISRAIIYGSLAAALTVIYIAVVVGIGALVGSRGNALLTIAASVAIALLFQPLRERARRFANRVVYGERATPYQALSDLVERMADAFAVDDVLQRTAAVLAQGVGADHVEIWLRVGQELRPASTWPADATRPGPTQLGPDETLPAFEGVTRIAAVRHGDELLGAVTLTKPRNETLNATEDKLVQDLASQAGLVLRNAGLTAELRSTIDELRASRRRLVEAGDEQRRKIERNLHDGAQQQLVALAVKLRLAHDLAMKEGASKSATMLAQARSDTDDALENLRDLARGIYPPLLADRGLAAAIEAQARKAALPVTVDADGVGRLSPEIEAAIYFCSLEALQNVAKYSRANAATVRIRTTEDTIGFEVQDDGAGFDPATTERGTGLQGMADRLEAVGGSLEIHSAPGRGTTVRGRVCTLDGQTASSE